MNNIQSKILSLIKEEEGNIINYRRHIHMNPELSFNEEKTAEYICNILDEINVPYIKNIGNTYGVMAFIGKRESEEAILIRADMDALPVFECTNREYASKVNGVMHACGHDCHTAILLGTIKVLKKLENEINGLVKFVFQPGEETDGGAEIMINEGVLENPKVSAAIALHTDPLVDCGKINIKDGPLYASPDEFDIIIKGKGGHGAEPELCINPIVVASEIIKELTNLTDKNTDSENMRVVSICSAHSGNTTNVIPDSASITGTARAMTTKMRDFLELEIENIVKKVTEKYDVKYTYDFRKMFPPLINDKTVAEKIYNSAKTYLKDNAIYGGEHTMAGEDFSYFAQSVPSALFKLGCKNEKKSVNAPLHSSHFDIDEECMKYGVMIFSDFAIRYFLN